MSIVPTKQDLRWASSHYLCETLPSDYDEWSDKKLDKFIEDNAWEFFEYADPKFIWEQIESLAWSMKYYIKEDT